MALTFFLKGLWIPFSEHLWRYGRDSNPRPPAWQAGILTSWTTTPYWEQSLVWTSLRFPDCAAKIMAFSNAQSFHAKFLEKKSQERGACVQFKRNASHANPYLQFENEWFNSQLRPVRKHSSLSRCPHSFFRLSTGLALAERQFWNVTVIKVMAKTATNAIANTHQRIGVR